MGAIKELQKELKGEERTILPMGRAETTKKYKNNTTLRQIVVDAGMTPTAVDVIADGEEASINEKLGSRTDITIVPKQKGG